MPDNDRVVPVADPVWVRAADWFLNGDSSLRVFEWVLRFGAVFVVSVYTRMLWNG